MLLDELMAPITEKAARRILVATLAIAGCTVAQAALVEFGYSNVVGAGPVGGSPPWLHVKIEDAGADTLKFTVTSMLGSIPALATQTLTGL